MTVVQAFAAEKHAKSGEVVIAETAHRLISSHFKAEERYPDGFVRMVKGARYCTNHTIIKLYVASDSCQQAACVARSLHMYCLQLPLSVC
jgi:hypothetical protein